MNLLSLAVVLLGLSSGSPAVPSADAAVAAPDSVAVAVERPEAAAAVAGPFYSYAAAADYADYLEDEFGFHTRVVYQYGRYYVLYW